MVWARWYMWCSTHCHKRTMQFGTWQRHMSQPAPKHMKAMLYCMKHCVDMPNHGLVLKPDMDKDWDWSKNFVFIIGGRSDSDYTKELVTRRSVSWSWMVLRSCSGGDMAHCQWQKRNHMPLWIAHMTCYTVSMYCNYLVLRLTCQWHLKLIIKERCIWLTIGLLEDTQEHWHTAVLPALVEWRRTPYCKMDSWQREWEWSVYRESWGVFVWNIYTGLRWRRQIYSCCLARRVFWVTIVYSVYMGLNCGVCITGVRVASFAKAQPD